MNKKGIVFLPIERFLEGLKRHSQNLVQGNKTFWP
jgi:hypothetical protein